MPPSVSSSPAVVSGSGPFSSGGSGANPGVAAAPGIPLLPMGGHPNLMQTPSPAAISALVSQHRLLELSCFNMRSYDLAQHMLTQQGAVSKLLGECKSPNINLSLSSDADATEGGWVTSTGVLIHEGVPRGP